MVPEADTSTKELDVGNTVDKVEAEGVREEREIVLGDEKKTLDVVEEVGETLGGGAASRVTEDLTIEGMTDSIPKMGLVQATKDDETLSHLYKLATLDREGYHLDNDILFRSRFDSLGQTREQICLPTTYRQQCLKLAHNSFGHQGRTKMVEIIKRFFYWPNMTNDCLNHV